MMNVVREVVLVWKPSHLRPAVSDKWIQESSLFRRSFQVVCQLEGGTQMLCVNRCGAEELNPLHLVPEYDNRQDDLPSGTVRMKIISARNCTCLCSSAATGADEPKPVVLLFCFITETLLGASGQ